MRVDTQPREGGFVRCCPRVIPHGGEQPRAHAASPATAPKRKDPQRQRLPPGQRSCARRGCGRWWRRCGAWPGFFGAGFLGAKHVLEAGEGEFQHLRRGRESNGVANLEHFPARVHERVYT